MYICIYVYVCIYIYIYTYREREILYLTHQRFRRVRAFGAQSLVAGKAVVATKRGNGNA